MAVQLIALSTLPALLAVVQAADSFLLVAHSFLLVDLGAVLAAVRVAARVAAHVAAVQVSVPAAVRVAAHVAALVAVHVMAHVSALWARQAIVAANMVISVV